MAHIDIDTLKETRARRERPTNLNELLISLRKLYKTESKDDVTARFLDRLREDDGFIDQSGMFWVSLNWNKLVEPAKPAKPQTKKMRRSPAVAAAAAAVVVEKIKDIVLLDLVMPNGKKIRHGTGREVLNFGGGFAKLACRIGGDDIFGEHFSEADVRRAIALA